ncbi:MAG: hypothetical protein C0505_07880 [Leptothrix sp. (in: Bacteria)]|nr:hypothetical protein [Leptothrix sp. (in: b-proteobacteria)]
MQRRAALTALAWGCNGIVLPGLAGAASPLAAQVLVWGPGGCVAVSADGTQQHLPDAPAAGTRPALTALGLWLVDTRGALRCWEPGAGPAWTLRHTVPFASPVHALAASPDGRWVAAAHGEALSLLDAAGRPMASFEGSDLARTSRGAATALFMLPQRRSFVATWPALGEVWEISLDPQAAPIFDGLVHDYRMGEAIAKPGYLGARRAPLGRPLPGFNFADARVPWLAGTLGAEVVVMHLDVRRRIAALRADAAHPAGAALRRSARDTAAFEWWLPSGPEVQVFDTRRWVRLATHTLPGPVRQLQAVDANVWALVGGRDDPSLWQMANDASGWHPVETVTAPVVAMSSTPQGSDLLVLQREPPALLRLNHDGSPKARWPLPATTPWQGLSVGPAA